MNGSGVLLTFTISGRLLLVGVLLLYLSGLCMNVLLVLVIGAEARLHRPMYELLGHLALGGLLGSSWVSFSLLKHLLGPAQSSLHSCLSQVFFTNLYASSMFCILALMAYERHVAVCEPLLYHAIMRPARLRLLLLLLYLLLATGSFLQVYLASRPPLCRRSVDKLLCDGLAVSGLSCQSGGLVGAVGLCCAAAFIVLPCLLVLLSYCRVCAVVLRLSGASRRRAAQTRSPHLLAFLNFSGATFCGVAHNHLGPNAPKAIHIFSCISFFLIPPLLNPIIYGIKMKEIRLSISSMRRSLLLRIR